MPRLRRCGRWDDMLQEGRRERERSATPKAPRHSIQPGWDLMISALKGLPNEPTRRKFPSPFMRQRPFKAAASQIGRARPCDRLAGCSRGAGGQPHQRYALLHLQPTRRRPTDRDRQQPLRRSEWGFVRESRLERGCSPAEQT